MIKGLRKIFFLLLFLPIMALANSLERINYRDGEIKLTFSEKVPSYTEVFDSSLPAISLNFKDIAKSTKVQEVVEINDIYLMDILTEEYNKQIDMVIYLKSNTDYTIYSKGKNLYIRLKDEITAPKKKHTIVLDAGHGGKDSGARNGDTLEKDLALAVVLELYKELKGYYNVILTRDTDIFIPLDERANIGNRANADLFVSIHLNAARNTSARGTEVFYFSKNPSSYARQLAKYENDFDKKGTRAIETSNFLISDVIYHLIQKQSATLANTVLDELVQAMNTERRKVVGANFAVLRGSKSNSILVELGFITNNYDKDKYESKEGQVKAAKAIARAIRKHY